MTSFPLPMFFVHIDKTGGLSVIEVLRKYFEPNEICAHAPNDAWLPGDLPGYKLYAGHFTYDFFTGQGGTKLIMMRHPVETMLVLDELLFGFFAHGHVVRDVREDVAPVRVEGIASNFDVDEGSVLASQLQAQRHLRIRVA